MAVMEKQSEHQKEVIHQLKNNFIPKMASLIGKSFKNQDLDRISNSFLSEIFDEVDYQFKKTK